MSIIGFKESLIYQDKFEVWRDVAHTENGITKQERTKVTEGWGRIYQNPTSSINNEETIAGIDKGNQLMCPFNTDMRTGDEVVVYRSARIGEPIEVIKYIAGNPNRYKSPFGGFPLKTLEHLQVSLHNAERVE